MEHHKIKKHHKPQNGESQTEIRRRRKTSSKQNNKEKATTKEKEAKEKTA